MPELKIRRLGYALGAEIRGLDLRRPLDDETFAAIRRAWLDHVVLCFPDQDLSPQEMMAFCSRFGRLNPNRTDPHLQHPDYAETQIVVNKPIRVKEKVFDGTRADKWHSDLSVNETPPSASFLNAKVLPDVGGDTMFCNMYLAYETLSPAFQRAIEGLEGVHDITLNANFAYDSPEVQAARRQLSPPVVHPVVRVHPETGRKALYVGVRIRNFVGMSEEETKPLLAFLNEHATRYEFTYRHGWTVYDLLMWDNRCAMHYAVPDFDQGQLRRMQRCNVLGEKSGRTYAEVSAAASSV